MVIQTWRKKDDFRIVKMFFTHILKWLFKNSIVLNVYCEMKIMSTFK